MLKFIRNPIILKPVSWFILASFLVTTSGCYYYRVNKTTEPPSAAIKRMQSEGKLMILHLDDKVWNFTNFTIDDQFIKGNIFSMPENYQFKESRQDAANRYKKKDSQILNEVHIYISEFTRLNTSGISIPLSAVQKIEVNEKATGATIASWGFSSLLVGAGVFGVFMLIVMLTKSSCPFIYSFNGTDFIFSGEIFSGATQPGLERDDYLALPDLTASEGKYKIKITNEVHEIQSVNFAELLVFNGAVDQSVLMDKYGTGYSVKHPVGPVEAGTPGNNELTEVLGQKDTLVYTGAGSEIGKNGIREIEMKFMRSGKSPTAKLIIRAKNSFWLDGIISKIHMLFGDRYDEYASKQENAPGEKLKKWQLGQNIPLSVFIEKKGKWEFVDYFNIAGPMALRDDILSIDLKDIDSDTVKIKLVTGYLFWEIDYAAMDFSEKEVLKPISLPVSNAVDNYGTDIKDLLLKTDNLYYRQKVTGDEALLTFDAVDQKSNSRTVFLHTRGYYKILSEPSGKPDKKKLKTFRKPNSIPAFSKETFDKLSGDTLSFK